MAEWSNAAVLKTVEGHTSGGSNPSSSAKENPQQMLRVFYFLKPLKLASKRRKGIKNNQVQLGKGFYACPGSPFGINAVNPSSAACHRTSWPLTKKRLQDLF